MSARQEEDRSGKDGGEIEWKLSEFDSRAVSRGQNELIVELKMAAGYMISIRGAGYGGTIFTVCSHTCALF